MLQIESLCTFILNTTELKTLCCTELTVNCRLNNLVLFGLKTFFSPRNCASCNSV